MTAAGKPSINRMVHYVSYGTPNGEYASCCRAAVITETGAPGSPVGLAVINPTGLFFHSITDGGCRYAEPGPDGRYPGGTWHWPEFT